MLVTDVGDEMCSRQLWDVGDRFRRFRHQHRLSLNNSVGHQHPKDVTNIEILSPTTKNRHQYKITNIHLSPTSMLSWQTVLFLSEIVILASIVIIDHRFYDDVCKYSWKLWRDLELLTLITGNWVLFFSFNKWSLSLVCLPTAARQETLNLPLGPTIKWIKALFIYRFVRSNCFRPFFSHFGSYQFA